MKKTGPNNMSHIVWALVSFLKYISLFFFYLLTMFYRFQLPKLISKRRDPNDGVTIILALISLYYHHTKSPLTRHHTTSPTHLNTSAQTTHLLASFGSLVIFLFSLYVLILINVLYIKLFMRGSRHDDNVSQASVSFLGTTVTPKTPTGPKQRLNNGKTVVLA